MNRRYRFGDVLIDQQSFRLLQAGKPLAIEPKALNVLIFLVQHEGRLVERRELLSAVWGDTFVTDHVLSRSIGQIRKVLGDDSREPRFIETVPTLGYRFIAAVETVDGPVQATEGLNPGTETEPDEQLLPMAPVPPEMDEPSETTDTVLLAGVSEPDISAPEILAPKRAWQKRSPWLYGVGLAALIVAMVFVLREFKLPGALGSLQAGQSRRHPEGPIRSLAVLPLDDLSPGTREDYFADGMTDELITELARIPGLRVVSRTSVMQDKGSRKPLAQIARELDVDAVVEGSVVRSDGRVRITAQLIDARSDRHLWAESFEGPLGNVLSLQDSVAREISLQTSAVLTPAARGGLANAKHLDPGAHDAYLRGLYFIQRRDASLAADYFRKAIALEPEYGAANAGLAEALVMHLLEDGEHAHEIVPSAVAAARRAIELDPEGGAGYTALGAIDTSYTLDWSAAEQSLRKGIELSPSSSDAEIWLAIYLTSVGRPSDAVDAMRRAVALDPLSFWANRLLGSMLYYSRRYDEALAALKRASELAPDQFGYVEAWKSGVYEMQGRYGDALPADLKDLGSDLTAQDIQTFRSAFETGGWKGYQEARVRYLLPRSVGQCYMNPIAMSYVRLGNLGEAFRWFNRDVDSHCGRTVFDLAADPRLDGMREDPRFAVLLRRVNLPH